MVSVQYDLADPNMTVTSCFLRAQALKPATTPKSNKLKPELTEEGFKLVSERA